jgi:hypothetical protein
LVLPAVFEAKTVLMVTQPQKERLESVVGTVSRPPEMAQA